MPVRVKSRRREPRSRIPDFQDAEIEFTETDGTAHKQSLIDLSVSGCSFQLAERIPDLEVGTPVEASVIWMDEFRIHVNFVIRHVTRKDGRGYGCGVQFYMMSNQARNEMAALVSRIQLYLQLT